METNKQEMDIIMDIFVCSFTSVLLSPDLTESTMGQPAPRGQVTVPPFLNRPKEGAGSRSARPPWSH